MTQATQTAEQTAQSEARAIAPRTFPGDGLVALCREPEAIQKEAWFVWNKYGRKPSFAHPREDLANAEAARLAAANPGRSFIVMRSTQKFRVEPARAAEPVEASAS